MKFLKTRRSENSITTSNLMRFSCPEQEALARWKLFSYWANGWNQNNTMLWLAKLLVLQNCSIKLASHFRLHSYLELTTRTAAMLQLPAPQNMDFTLIGQSCFAMLQSQVAYEDCMMDTRLYEMAFVVLKDLQCQSWNSSKPHFVAIKMGFSVHYRFLVLVVKSRNWIGDIIEMGAS